MNKVIDGLPVVKKNVRNSEYFDRIYSSEPFRDRTSTAHAHTQKNSLRAMKLNQWRLETAGSPEQSKATFLALQVKGFPLPSSK